MQISDVLFYLLRSEICGECPGEETMRQIKNVLADDGLSELYDMSKSHDMSHIVAVALYRYDLVEKGDPIAEKFAKSQYLAMCRFEKFKYARASICEAFERHKIDYILLKGAVICDLYPEPWMRTSGDIDILVRDKDVERAVDVICDELSYTTDRKRQFHDISLYSPDGVHLELHFNIMETIDKMDAVLSRVWDFADPISAGESRYDMTAEYRLFHSIAHCAYHFVGGGCGVRPIIDLWLLIKSVQYDSEVLNGLLNQSGLARFYEVIVELMDVWIGGKEYTELTQTISDYILRSGVYGIMSNRVAMRTMEEKSKYTYLAHRVFLPYKMLKITYPILERYPVLTPIYQVVRWVRVLLGKGRNKAMREIGHISMMSEEKGQLMAYMRDELDLNW